jgi:ATP-dependent helicase HrpB
MLVAEPGAGKTTRAPLALLADTAPEQGRWLLLEPRRVAVRLAATYMAEQLGEKPGQTVGYRVRGEQKISVQTRLEVITQGIFTRMLQDDPLLQGVAGVIFDEFHERSLEADLGLALALDVQQSLREDLKIVVMSATLDVAALQKVLGSATTLIDCPGRNWPVNTFHRTPALREYPEQHQARVVREALLAHQGHMLVFLPGQKEIRRLHSVLQESLPADTELHSLHGQLTLAQQQSVLRPPTNAKRRIILSTAIAESSVTVPGVRIVIDAGKERVPQYQARSGLSRLDTRQVNRASADQRRGRAGREAAGFCYRLWSEAAVLQAHREPEILQADLSALVFELIRWGVKNADDLQWVNPPAASALKNARLLLDRLGLLAANGGLSSLGQRCVRWPTHPRLAVLLETAADHRALPLACWLLAWLEEAPATTETDIAHIIEHAAMNTDRRLLQTARQWADRLGCGLQIADISSIDVLLAHAYPDRIAVNQGQGRFKLVTGGQAVLKETDSLSRADYIVAVALDGKSSAATVFQAVATRAEVLESCFEECRQWRSSIVWNELEGRLQAEELRGLGAVILARRPLRKLPEQEIVTAFMQALRRRGELRWSDEDMQTLGRLRLLHRTLGKPWPDVSKETLLATLETWLAPWLSGVSRMEQVDKLPLGRYLLDNLEWSMQQQLDQLVPTHLQVPSGNRIRIDYRGEEPVLAVKLQEMFGQVDTPHLINNQVAVLIHLLSPARRPVQLTADLASFWAKTYFEVRKDLKGRYPRHPWPDDPLQAQATHRAKPRPR